MASTSQFLLTLGSLLLFSLALPTFGRHSFLPRVTLLLIFGIVIGGYFSKSSRKIKQWLGIALLPQAGVAVGMALLAAQYFPEYCHTLLSMVIVSMVFFETIGPVLTRLALQ